MVNDLDATRDATKAHPLTFRLPRPGEVDVIYGLNRSAWNELILASDRNQYNPPVKSIVIKKRNAKRGIRLIVMESAKAYFDKLIAGEVSA